LSVNKNLEKGHLVRFEDLESKKPHGIGISASIYEKILGKTLKNSKNKYDFLSTDDLEN
jgi:N-acetylneuraminate synthase